MVMLVGRRGPRGMRRSRRSLPLEDEAREPVMLASPEGDRKIVLTRQRCGSKRGTEKSALGVRCLLNSLGTLAEDFRREGEEGLDVAIDLIILQVD